MGILTLTTDFGTSDGYVAEMKGVVLSRAPGTVLVDVTHEIAPGDVEEAARVLGRIWDRFPAGTVHLVVVDPGVGSDRRPLALRATDRWMVGPDNGVATRVLERHRPLAVRALDPHRCAEGAVSPTFHGRDLFAPAAAHLCSGGRAEALGEPVEAGSLVRLPVENVIRVGHVVRGRVVHVDRFGNLITNIPGASVAPGARIEVGGTVVSGVRTAYVHGEPGRPLAVIGSGGTLEISVRDGSAAELLGAGRGAEVRVEAERG
ncbi:MAG: SAM-dependent chlorinase/fluorinase [Gemmatimonadota bacterium]